MKYEEYAEECQKKLSSIKMTKIGLTNEDINRVGFIMVNKEIDSFRQDLKFVDYEVEIRLVPKKNVNSDDMADDAILEMQSKLDVINAITRND